MPFQNPLTETLYTRKRINVLTHFPFLEGNQHILSFESYFEELPQKFYNKEAFDDFLCFLNDNKHRNPYKLSQLLNERESRISLSIINLDSVNNKNFHNIRLPKDYELSIFLNEYIHFDLLKLWESPFYEFFYLLAYISREKRGKNTTGLDLHNVLDELRFLPLEYDCFNKYQNLCDTTIRNGIGHGKIDFLDSITRYTDKNGNSVEKYNNTIVSMFDDVIDTLNGFCFALKVFYLTNKEYLNRHTVNIPNSIMLKELVVGASAPKWEIKACLDSTVRYEPYLNIFIDTDFVDLMTLRMSIFHTGILAAELTKKYKTISIHMKNRLCGLAMLNADKIREVTSLFENPQLVDYVSAYHNDSELLFFAKFNRWQLLAKIERLIYIGKASFPLHFRRFYEKFRRKIEIISTNIHAKKWFTVVEGKVVVDVMRIDDAPNYVRQHYKSIIGNVANEAKEGKSIFSKLWLLPAKFVTVEIFVDNVRVREWRNTKTKDIKICTIRLNKTKNIKTPVVYPKSTDIMGNYTILWNNFLEE